MEFFDSIEFSTEDYHIGLYNDEFYNNLVSRHPRILEAKFKAIYDVIKEWDQVDRSTLCENIRQSNQIEAICKGTVKATLLEDVPDEIRNDVDELFYALYEKVLKKSPHFIKFYGSVIEHFRELKKSPNDFLKCPACGIRDVETIYDDERDQYDHYLAKSIYPFSSVNFKNLVPICQKCNSLDVKSSIDIISETTGFVFYPYTENHKGISISISVKEDNMDINKIKYGFAYSNPDGNQKEIESWKYIFKIEKRHNNFVRGRIGKWYKVYWKFINNKKLNFLNEEQKRLTCFTWMDEDETEDLSFVRKPALEAFIDQSALGQAQEQIKLYALYNNK
ncbi:hypothetical protein ACH3PA_01160 [Leeuwenhoekiella sp. A2]|uniref:hypothetical protein n=1 Tax=Leeuwenhoekiella sp. A2 TaxID=3141460 RepID=UPI003A7FD532